MMTTAFDPCEICRAQVSCGRGPSARSEPKMTMCPVMTAKIGQTMHEQLCIRDQCAWWEHITGTCCVKTQAYLAAFQQAGRER